MTEPTKADLKAAVAKLTTENAQLAKENTALLELLAAVRAYADMPHPADYANHKYPIELENRLDSIAIWANADRDDMIQDVYLPVLAYRAKELRERAAKPVRYEVRAKPEPVITDSGRTCDQANPGSGAWCHRDGDLCELPLKHGGDHRAPGNEEGDPDITWSDEPRGYLRCEDTSPAGGFTCTLKLKHEGLHAQLTLTGAFMAEWGYADGHVHTTAEIPASVSS